MTLVIKDATEEQRTPHLALTHNSLQGGSANKRNVSLLMKNSDGLSETVIKALKSLGLLPEDTPIDKAAFYSQTRVALQNAVSDKYGEGDGWLYVEDFNDSVVIFCTKEGVWSTAYSLVNGAITLSDLASPVQQVMTYEPKTGNMLLSEDAEDKLEEGVYGLVTKALQTSETKEHFTEMFKCLQLKKETEVIKLQEEIEKAVAAADVLFKAQLAEQTVLLQKALDEVATYQAQAKEQVAKARQAAITLVEKDAEKAAVLEKALEALPQEAFDVVMKSMQDKADVVEESDLFVQKSKNTEVEVVAENATMQILKAQYATK